MKKLLEFKVNKNDYSVYSYTEPSGDTGFVGYRNNKTIKSDLYPQSVLDAVSDRAIKDLQVK